MKKQFILFLVMMVPALVLGQNVMFGGFTKSQLTNNNSASTASQQKTQLEQKKPEIVLSTKKNIGKAMLLSILLPGAGEYYMGHSTMGKFLIGIDVSLWGTFWGSKHLEDVKISDYKNHARQHADIGNGKYNSHYWIQLGNHMDIYENNERELIDRNIDNIYTDIDKYYWNWDSNSNLIKYNQLRIDANNMSKLTDKMVMGLFINRLISIVNVIRINKNMKNKEKKVYSVDWKLDYNYSHKQGDYVGISMIKAF